MAEPMARLPPPHQLQLWTKEDVSKWLCQSHLDECVDAFVKRNIDGTKLMELTEEQFVLWATELKIKHKRQITKYLNQYRDDMTLKNARKKIRAITQQVKRSPTTPPPVPQVDYKWDDNENAQDDLWGSDFDSDLDPEDEVHNELNGNITHFSGGTAMIPVSHNVAAIVRRIQQGVTVKSKKNNGNDSASENDQLTVSHNIQFPAQPTAPLRKAKSSNSNLSDIPINTTSPSENKPSIATKPSIRPKPSASSKPQQSTSPVPSTFPVENTSALPSVPRPPQNFPSNRGIIHRNSIARPTQQPPPPPVKSQTPLAANAEPNIRSPDEYEIPNPYPTATVQCDASSTSSSSVSNLSNHNSVVTTDSYEPPEEQQHLTDSVDGELAENMWSGSSGISNFSSSSSSSEGSMTLGSERPQLPPRLTPGQQPIPPPLPKKPSTCAKDITLIRPNEKPVQLPTRSPKTDGIVLKTREGQFRTLGGTIKSKLANTLAMFTPEKGGVLRNIDYSNMSSQNGSRTASVSSLNETSGSMQNRPLPPVPDATKVDEQRLSFASISDNSKSMIEEFSWFHSVERDVAEQMLQPLESGAYIVRPSRRAGESSPYSLSIQYDNRVYHLNVRLKDDCKYALGKEKANEKTFDSVEELIEYHLREPIVLTVKGVTTGKTCLTETPEKT